MIASLQEADRLALLTRHAATEANLAKYAGSIDSRIQGLSKDMPIADPEGFLQSHAYGIALKRFVPQQRIDIVEVHASDTNRTITTRDVVLEHIPVLSIANPSQELWEHRKGNLEGMLRSEAYPDEATWRTAANDDWDYRHGTRESGGQTARETAERWLRWFTKLVQQPNFQPRANRDLPLPTILAFGHNTVAACGIALLNHDGQGPLPPVSDRTLRVAHATGLLLAESDGQWSVLPERLVPTPADFEEAEAYVTA